MFYKCYFDLLADEKSDTTSTHKIDESISNLTERCNIFGNGVSYLGGNTCFLMQLNPH